MPPAKKNTTPAARRYEDLDPTEQLAHDIVSAASDLSPSVQRIMQAELDAEQRHRALQRFQQSLGHIGDPFRDPRYAIAHCDDAL